VVGIRQRRKVYALTPSGRSLAVGLRERVTTQKVRIRDGDAVREGSLHEVLQGPDAKARLLEAVRQVELAGVLDLESLRHPPDAGLVEQLGDAPQVTTFVGRRGELDAITHEDADPRVFVIRGIAGIGKSTLASRACTLVRGRRNLFWHRIRPWESDSMVLASLVRFLEALDRPGLSSVLRRGEPRLAAEVLRQDLPDTHSFLVLDDVHEASPQTLAVIQMIVEAVASAPDVRLLVLTRRALPIYDVRDIVVRGVVREIELDGLKPEEAAALLTEAGDEAQLAGLGKRLAGHPLLIELVRKRRSDLPGAIRDVHRFIEEAVYRELTEAERTTMKAASLYRVPVPRASLLSIPGSSYEALADLQERSLLRFVGDERYEIHDTVRDFFSAVLVPEESRKFGAAAVTELRALAARFSATGDVVSAIGCLSNAKRLTSDLPHQVEILEELGDAEIRLGDFPAALIAYREAIGLAAPAASAARLHRKIASALQWRGEMASASAEIEAAVRSLAARDDVERGWLNLVGGRISLRLERWSEGREHDEAALTTFRSFGDVRGQAEALIDLGHIEANSPEGRPAAAREYLEEALRLSGSLGDPTLVASVHVEFANLEAYRLGNADRAMEHLAAIEALPAAQVDVRGRQSMFLLKGEINLDLRAEFEAARANFADALTLAAKTHHRYFATLARGGAATARYHAGDCAGARSEFVAVASEWVSLGLAGPAVESLYLALESCLVVGDLEGYRAIAAQLESPALVPGLEVRPVLAHVIEGIERLARGDRHGAHAALQEAIRNAERGLSPMEQPLIPFAHDLYAAVLDAMGEQQASAEEEQLAIELSHRFGLNGRLVARAKLMDGVHRSLRQLLLSSKASAAKGGAEEPRVGLPEPTPR